MSLAQIVLTTNKTTSNVGDYVRKIGQGERGQVLPVVVIDANGAAYDLTNKSIVFSENKDSGKYVVDDGKASTSGKFTMTDPQNGKFSYALQDQVYPESGTAWFDIVSADGTVLDTTVTFKFVVIPNATLHVDSDSYSSTLEALQAHYQGVIKNTEVQTQNLINSLTDKINRAISNGQRDVANQLTDMQNQLQAIQNRENGLIQNWTADFNTRKADFDKLKSDWQAQSKAISDSYQAKINEINTQAQSQHNDIQATADQQLKNNQSANDAEIAKIESEAKAKLDEVEKAKNDAIAELTAQRDAAISQAKVDFQAKIDAFQKDYDAWKSATLADFTKQLADINTNISNDQSTLSDFDKKLDYTKQELADMAKQLDSLDFTKFVTGDQFKETMAKKASGLKVRGLRGDYVMAVDTTTSNIDGTPAGNGSGLVDSTVLAGVMQTISDAILGKNHYTKSEVDNLLKGVKDQLQPLIEQKADATTLTDRANALARQIGDLQTENSNLKNVNAQLQQQNDNLQKQVTKLTPVHVSNVDDVANQNTFFVIVDD